MFNLTGLTISNNLTMKLLTRFICGMAKNYTMCGITSHTIILGIIMTWATYLQDSLKSHIYLYHYRCKNKYCYLKINALICTTIYFIQFVPLLNEHDTTSRTQIQTYNTQLSKHMPIPGVHIDLAVCIVMWCIHGTTKEYVHV
jgi:hypothetical protein